MTFTEGLFETVNNTGEGISDLASSVGEVFINLAQILGETAIHLYSVLVRQQVVYGIQSLIVFLSYLSFSVISLFLYHRLKKTTHFHREDKLVVYVFLFMMAFYGVSSGLPYFNEAIGYFINPEYYAIIEAKSILQSLK